VADIPKLSPTTILVLQAIANGQVYGYGIMQHTGLPSGTIYPILSRLEREDLILSRWEKRLPSEQDQRPPRKYYRLTSKAAKLLATAEGKHGRSERVKAVNS
jgi:PadR family transcriptional regulator PadR